MQGTGGAGMQMARDLSLLAPELARLDGAPLAAAAGLVAVLVGLGYKAAIAPFHFWAVGCLPADRRTDVRSSQGDAGPRTPRRGGLGGSAGGHRRRRSRCASAVGLGRVTTENRPVTYLLSSVALRWSGGSS
jgi:hypothetical protein